MLGAVVVNFSPLYTVDELAHQVEDSGTRLMFTLSAKALLPTALAVLERSSLERLVVGSIAEALPSAKAVLYRVAKRKEITTLPADPRITPYAALVARDRGFVAPAIDPVRDVALVQYTGGTTGSPKGAMLTHQNLTANARQVVGVDPDAGGEDRISRRAAAVPHLRQCLRAQPHVCNGGEMVLLPRFEAGQALAAVTRTRATSFRACRPMYQALLQHPNIGKTDFSSLRVCISGGAPLPQVTKERFEAATGAKLIEGYGLTESGIASTNPYLGEVHAGTIGQPLPATRFRLVDREDPTRPAPDGRARRDRAAGSADHGGLLEPSPSCSRRRSSTAGCAPAMSARSTATASSASSTG
jgi:long-chain acyl-CoA synthetase